jgi:hypothetical protein
MMIHKLTPLSGFLFLAMLLVGCSQASASQATVVSSPAATLEPTATTLLPTSTPAPTSMPTLTPTSEPILTSSAPTSVPLSTLLAECNSDDPPTFSDYATWTKVNSKPIKGHETWVNIYVNNHAENVYLSASGEVFPVCSKIVKTHLVSSESDTISAITIMLKMPAGYDQDHNDWWWGMYDRTGQVAEMSGKLQVCVACHQPVADADYVFSKAVLAEAKK